MKRTQSSLMVFSIFLFVLVSCNKNQRSQPTVFHKPIEKNFELSDSLMNLYSLHNDSIRLRDVLSTSPTMLTVFESDCSSCISNLRNWMSVLSKESLRSEQFIFIAIGSNEAWLDYYVDEKIDFQLPIFFLDKRTHSPFTVYLDKIIILKDLTNVSHVFSKEQFDLALSQF